ncbi:hypothetical protein Vadar_007898 [Vaccinium darrowii]|uniref:Uncharacterized protein n=1 Tax=Vaccinium darrowii TaxID=229202 RepID=A0ACB7Z320_9ERIC|nr:hypothetical protein Vadar_007898 [Vaccinium darrowii]
MVRQSFNQEDAELILEIPLPRYDMEDNLIWNFSAVGNYSVKSSYETALDLKKNGFMGTKAQGECSNRDRMKEVIWRISPLGLAVGLNQSDSMISWWDSLLERWKGVKENKKIWAVVGTIIWRIWLCRNDMVFNSKKWEPDVACQLAASDAVDFLEVNTDKVQDSTGVDHRKKVGGLGIVNRDFNGSFRAARAIHIGNFMELMGIETMAARELGFRPGIRQYVSELDVSFVRSGNSVAHCVAKNALGGNGSCT